MTYSDDLDCKIFVDTDVPARELAVAVAQLLSGTAAGPWTWTVSTADCAIDVLPNDDFDEERREAFPDGFLNFRYALEVYPRSGQPHDAIRQVVARLLEHLWAQGIPAVAACDYEPELPSGGGYKSGSVPWPKSIAPSATAPS
jgi:hypothetical protein